jgi:hypothetical protein
MTAFVIHGAHDVDPTFLSEAHDGDAVYDVGAIISGIVFGTLSERVIAPSRSERSEPGLPEG